MKEDILKNIVYISLPEDINKDNIKEIDPSILLPVEINPDNGYSDINNLSWEMIIAAALKILAYDPEHQDCDYYRKLILAVRPDIKHELTSAAIAKATEKDYALAEEIFTSLTGLLPGDFTTILNTALLYEEMADSYLALEKAELSDICNEKAFEAYKKLLALYPDSTEVHFNSGLFFLKKNNLDKALEHLTIFIEKSSDKEKIDKIKPIVSELSKKKNSDSLFYEAYDAIRMGHEDKGISLIKDFLEHEPEVWNAWFLLGWAYRRQSLYKEGIEAFNKAISYGSNQVDTYNELAICLMETGALDSSRNHLLTALKMEPENIKILSNLGIVSFKSEDNLNAEKYFRKVLELAPEDRIAADYLKRL